MAGEQLRLQPFGDDEYKVLIMGRVDDGLSIFVNVGRKLLEEYSATAITALSELGYQGDQKHLMQDISVAWYARVTGNEEVPRTVLWDDDPKETVLERLRDVICNQGWDKTINQNPEIQKVFPKLNFGVVADDPLGFARGAAVRGLIAASYEKETPPIVYFDQMRKYPAFARDLLQLIQKFKIDSVDISKFDTNFGYFMIERFEAAAEVLNARKPGAEPWEPWPLRENLIWQKYIDDWGDYQYWLGKKQGTLDSPQL